MFLSVVNGRFDGVEGTILTAHWRAGADRGVEAALGVGAVGQGEGDIAFVITETAPSGDGVLGCEAIDLPDTGWALRLDEVAFPVGAVAHKHTHTGSGWRHLVSGSLRIEAEDETTTMGVGDSWFEPAHSPVRAVALHETGTTRFVRCMVISLADVGRSTFKLARPQDAELPRLQMTHRHFDHIV